MKPVGGSILKTSSSSSSLSSKDVEAQVCTDDKIVDNDDIPVTTPDEASIPLTPVVTEPSTIIDDSNGTPIVINQAQLDTSVVTPILHATSMDTPKNTPIEAGMMPEAGQVSEDEISKIAQQLLKVTMAAATDGAQADKNINT